jgi:hypothetical protein
MRWINSEVIHGRADISKSDLAVNFSARQRTEKVDG